MPRKKSLSFQSRAADLLLEISDTFSLLSDVAYSRSPFLLYGNDGKRYQKAKEEYWEKRKTLKRLQEKKLLVIQKAADQYRIALTEEGARQVFRLKVMSADILPSDEVCMVIFDIPESEQKIRQKLRKFLFQAGFIPIQRSVWISNVDASQPLSELFEVTGAKKWIRVYRAHEIS